MTIYKTIREVAHAWAHASENDRGTTSNRSLSFHGGDLRSYNTQIMQRLDNGYCLINNSNYSVTTRKHVCVARMACADSIVVGYWGYAGRDFRFDKASVIYSYNNELKFLVEELAKAKQKRSKEKVEVGIAFLKNQLQILLNIKYLTKNELTVDLKRLLRSDTALDKLLEIKTKEFEKERKKLKIKALESLAKFRDDKINYIYPEARRYFKQDFVKLFKRGEYILTSQEVPIPIVEALKLYEACNFFRKTNKTYKKGDSGTRAKIGNYEVDFIDKKGNAKIGCHYITFEEIERCYIEEYLKAGGKNV